MISKDKIKKEEEEKLLIETSIMISIDHANIVKLFEVFKDHQFYYLVSEYCDGGELFEKIRHINKLTENVENQILIEYFNRKIIIFNNL